jgi:hypothetical protein
VRLPRNATVTGIKPGTFIKARNSKVGRGGYATLVIEGSDEDGPSIAAIVIDGPGLDQLIQRLTNMRKVLC